MSFQQTANAAVSYGRNTPPCSRFARAAAGGVLIGAILAGAAVAEPSGSKAPAPAVSAGSSEAVISSDWSMCRRAAADVEARVSAPEHLLSAVTLTETGRRGPSRKLQAWPWTINVGGKGFIFATKDEAVRAVQRLMKQGHRSIDVGCMQVNLKYHPRAFTSLEEAFDPVANVSYGADFIARLRQRHGSWQLAVQHYHSYTEEHRERYAARFNTLWTRERRRMAKTAQNLAAGRGVVRTAVQDSSVMRRLKPVAALLAFGFNLEALGTTAQEGDAFLKRLTGHYPTLADARIKSAALAEPVRVN